MENDLAQQIQNRIAELPEDIQRAIMSADLDKKIQDIGNKHALHIDQTASLGDETLLVMLGFSKPEEFPLHIATQVRVPPEEASKLSSDISEQIFMSIRESMKKFAEQKQTAEAAPNPTAPSLMPVKASDFRSAELMLKEKTVSVPTLPKIEPASRGTSTDVPPKPAPYKADPYREPAE